MSVETHSIPAPARWRRLGLPRLARLGLHRNEGALAGLLFAALSVAYFGRHVLTHLSESCACFGRFENLGRFGDPITYMWWLRWWPHSLLHGHDPFVTSFLFSPNRVDLGAVASLPGPAMLVSPITLLFGPLVSYNLLALSAPALAAFFAFLLCRYITRSFPAALVGGYLFGFSPYMLGHLLGHLDLTLIFPIPACVHLVLRAVHGRIVERRFVLALSVLLVVLFLTSAELTAMFVLVGLFAFALAALVDRRSRPRVLRALGLTMLAGGLAMLATSVFIYQVIESPRNPFFFTNFGDRLGADALGFWVPTAVIGLRPPWPGSVANSFHGGLPETGVYLGVPLVLIAARYAVTRWRAPATKTIFATLGLVVVLMLGSHLWVAGHRTIPLPWLWLSRLPLFDEAAPIRFGAFLFLIVAIITACWLAAPRHGWMGGAKWATAVLALGLLAPSVNAHLWRSRPDNPRLFTTAAYRTVIRRGAIVLALPFADNGPSMLWQAETGFWFRLPEGYVGALFPPEYAAAVAYAMFGNPPGPPEARLLRNFIVRQRVQVVVVDAADPKQWPAALARLGLRARSLAGTLVYQIPRSFH